MLVMAQFGFIMRHGSQSLMVLNSAVFPSGVLHKMRPCYVLHRNLKWSNRPWAVQPHLESSR